MDGKCVDDLDAQARLADVGSLLLRGLERLQAKERQRPPPLKLVERAGPTARRRRPVQRAEQQPREVQG